MQQQSTTVEVSAAALTLDTTTKHNDDDLLRSRSEHATERTGLTQLISVSPGFGGYNVGGSGPQWNPSQPDQLADRCVDNNDFWHNIPRSIKAVSRESRYGNAD